MQLGTHTWDAYKMDIDACLDLSTEDTDHAHHYACF